MPPIENMVVGQRATIDARSKQAGDVLGAHSIIDALVGVFVAARNASPAKKVTPVTLPSGRFRLVTRPICIREGPWMIAPRLSMPSASLLADFAGPIHVDEFAELSCVDLELR